MQHYGNPRACIWRSLVPGRKYKPGIAATAYVADNIYQANTHASDNEPSLIQTIKNPYLHLERIFQGHCLLAWATK